MGGNGGLDRGVPRQKGQSKTDPTQHHRHAAPPMRRADILGQIGGEVEAFQPFAQSGKAAGRPREAMNRPRPAHPHHGEMRTPFAQSLPSPPALHLRG
jgi:hypothetical protein